MSDQPSATPTEDATQKIDVTPPQHPQTEPQHTMEGENPALPPGPPLMFPGLVFAQDAMRLHALYHQASFDGAMPLSIPMPPHPLAGVQLGEGQSSGLEHNLVMNDPEVDNQSPTPATTTPKGSKAVVPLDPSAPAFLAEMLGPAKWQTFSAKLFERRLGGPKTRESKKRRQKEPQTTGAKGAKGKARQDQDDEDNSYAQDGDDSSSRPPAGTSLTGRSSHGATVIEFLVKTEVVKEVLRTYVPHPYNPLKSLAHPWAGSPTGAVVLTRPSVLTLCGWSNTQFSYWARRSEAIACLSQHDERLQKVRSVLEARMSRGDWAVNTTNEQADIQSAAALARLGINPSAVEDIITGKGLDAVIDQVKRRTGASQFIRGKHASLDPFGAVLGEDFAHGLGNPTLGNRLPLPPGITMGITAGFNVPGGIAVPALTGAGGGGGIRITDIRKRAAEAKHRGEDVPEEWLKAEAAAAAFAEAKQAGKGKRGPGKSKGLSGGDNHGSGSVQDQLTAAAIIDAMQRGVFGEFDPTMRLDHAPNNGQISQTPGAGPSGLHHPNVPTSRPVTEHPYDDMEEMNDLPSDSTVTVPKSPTDPPLRRAPPRQAAQKARATQTQVPSAKSASHSPPTIDHHYTLAQHAQAHAQDHTHPTHLLMDGSSLEHILAGQQHTNDEIDGAVLDPNGSRSSGESSRETGRQDTSSSNSLPQSLNAAFVASFALGLPSMGLPMPALPILPGPSSSDHFQESIIASSASTGETRNTERELSVLADVAAGSGVIERTGTEASKSAVGHGHTRRSSEADVEMSLNDAASDEEQSDEVREEADSGKTDKGQTRKNQDMSRPVSLAVPPVNEDGPLYFLSGSRLEESSERGGAASPPARRKRPLESSPTELGKRQRLSPNTSPSTSESLKTTP